MATTRLIPLHANKGMGIEMALKLRLGYIKDEYKTEDEIITEKTILTRNGKGEARWV